MIIGKKGQEVDKLTKELEDLCHRHIEVKTMEVNRPEVDPQLVAEDIAEQLEKRAELPPDDEAGHRHRRWRPGPRASASSWPAGWAGRKWPAAKSGMAGSIPLSTLRAKIEYGFAEAKTAQGHIGVKVWINNGDYLDPEDASSRRPAAAGPRQRETRLARRRCHAAHAQAGKVPQDARRNRGNASAATRSATATSACSRWKAAG